MNTHIQEIKKAAKMRVWSTLITECRPNGKNVKVWCEGKRYLLEDVLLLEKVLGYKSLQLQKFSTPGLYFYKL